MSNNHVTNNILNNLNAFSLSQFDKEHEAYRLAVFSRIIHTRLKKFQNLIRFEGDPKFTISKQRALFKAVFNNGMGGIFNKNKEIAAKVEEMIGKNIKEELSKTKPEDERIVLQVSGVLFNSDELLIEGVGFNLPRTNVGNKSYKITNDNCAILRAREDYLSPYALLIAFAYAIATADTIAKKRIQTIDTKIATNSMNNRYSLKEYNDIYDVGASFFKTQPSHSTFGGNDISMQMDISKMISTKIAKINLSAGEKLSDILEYIDKYISQVDHQMGIRTNTNKKQDRNITNEFTSDEVHFKLMENDFFDFANEFKENYKKVYGIDLTVVDMSKKFQDEEEAKNARIAGREGGEKDATNDPKDV